MADSNLGVLNKKKRIQKTTTIDLPADFSCGDCDICPFSYEEYVEYDDDGYTESDIRVCCVFGYSFENCRLKVTVK